MSRFTEMGSEEWWPGDGVLFRTLAAMPSRGRCGAGGVVEALDVLEDRVGELDPRAPPLPVQEFGLHTSPERLDDRVLFVFGPWRSAILLVVGDKTGQWQKWYEGAVPQAEQLFALYLEERAKVEEEGRD